LPKLAVLCKYLMQNNGYVWGAVVAVVIIVGAFFVFNARQAMAPGPMATSTTTGTSTSSGSGSTLPPGATVTQSSAPVTGIVAPRLNQPVTYVAGLSPEAAATIKADIATLSASLAANPAQSDKWLQLAVYYKAAGDYALAEQVWLYLTKAAPTNYIAFADLGDLYNNFIVNYPKAETNYLEAIKLKPDNINTYVSLYMMYKYQYKTNTTAAADILAQGLKANPNNPDLLKLQQSQ
jgi:tetratricopeptide (TPR) repeat protein